MAASVTLLSVAALLAVYVPGLHGGFFFDDFPNFLMVEGTRIDSITPQSLWDGLVNARAAPFGRNVSQLSFALNYYFNGFDPFAFKATNLAIHAVNGILVFLVSKRMLDRADPELGKGGAAFAASLVCAMWLLHPIQLLPVLHVVQRMTSLSALFLFVAILLHVVSRQRDNKTRWWLLALSWGLFWPLSFFSKETGVLFPMFVLAYELVILSPVRGTSDAFPRVLAGLVVAVVVCALAYALSPSGNWLLSGYDSRSFTLSERLLTEGRVMWLYLGLIFVPRLEAFGLHHDDIVVSHSLTNPPSTLLALCALPALAALAWWLRRRAPWVSFGIAWYLVGHALESTFLPLEIAHEHRNYVPLFGLLIPLAFGLTRLIQYGGVRRTVGAVLAVTAIGYPAFVTAMRAHLFGDDARRTQIEAQFHPESPRAQYAAGLAMASATISSAPDSPGRFFARRYYERAGALDPGFKFGWLGLIHLDCLNGVRPSPQWIAEFSRSLRDTPFAPGDRNVLFSLKDMSIAGTLCLDRQDVERMFDAALVNPTVSPTVKATIYSWLADYLTLKVRDIPAAQAALDRALVLMPGNPSNQLKRAQLAILQGRRDEASAILAGVDRTSLSQTERLTYKELATCLDAADTSVTCVGI